ncbi:CHRD domain-containing protein [Alkalicoccus urumqiensis]|uniref:CHRD domain-containing protein n=1 Tax=Alkalicoccus urumqiensis TaxID=1548213 RepID=A0A2P6MLA1_ALKUR|nr:CHRD domain-containing protein [Alkalicoccus urumqiensis]PRO67045.1 CHRD domain-containing protein [Alkalicoccus urumqiensis]
MKKVLAVSTASAVAFAGFTGAVSAAHEGQEFMADLSPEEEVMDVDSEATGEAHVEVSDDGESLDFTVEAHGLTDTLAGHLHSGPRGEDGPVELFLFENEEVMDYDGEVASGTLTEDDLVGDLSWEEFSEALVGGNIYVNLHTETFPDGEIRGQLEMADEMNGDEMADTASNGPLYAMIGLFTALAGGVMMIGRRKKVTA